jgi:hypothetical protein
MATALGTQLGTNLGTALGLDADAASELELIETFLALNLFSWPIFANSDVVGAKISDVHDNVAAGVGAKAVDANHVFTQANDALRPAATAVDAALNGVPASQFSGSTWLASSIAAVNWRFTHDGTGCLRLYVIVPDNVGATSIIAGSDSGGTNGFNDMVFATAQYRASVGNASASIFDVRPGSLVNGVGAVPHVTYSETASPNVSARVGDGTPVTANTTLSPILTDASSTVRLGTRADGALPFVGRMSEAMFAKNPTPEMMTKIDRYMQLKYGFFLT